MPDVCLVVVLLCMLTFGAQKTISSPANFSTEARLATNLLLKYNKQIRPDGINGRIVVKVGMDLLQIISVNAKSELLTTTSYMTYVWVDKRLTWTPSDYDGINLTRIGVDYIWTPTIILENSQVRHMQESLRVMALVHFDGEVEWLPPAIYRSSCIMSMNMFPFDWQNCSLVFRSSNFDQSQMTFDFAYTNQITVDKNAFVPNGEWDLLQKPITILQQKDDSKFQKVSFNLIIKRRPQFYVMNLLLPCVMLSILACFVFYLPVVAGEKISLAISLLLGYTIFIFLLAQVMPSTSLAVPIFASYLLFTTILLCFSILCCVIVYNFHFRSLKTHKMPKRFRDAFLTVIGPFLGLKQPNLKWRATSGKAQTATENKSTPSKQMLNGNTPNPDCGTTIYQEQAQRLGFRPRFKQSRDKENGEGLFVPLAVQNAPVELRPTLNFINYVTGHVRLDRKKEIATDDWAFVAYVLDRLVFWIYLMATLGGLVGFYVRVLTAHYPELI